MTKSEKIYIPLYLSADLCPHHRYCCIVAIHFNSTDPRFWPFAIMAIFVTMQTILNARNTHKFSKIVTKFWIPIKRTDRSHRCPVDTNKESHLEGYPTFLFSENITSFGTLVSQLEVQNPIVPIVSMAER